MLTLPNNNTGSNCFRKEGRTDVKMSYNSCTRIHEWRMSDTPLHQFNWILEFGIDQFEYFLRNLSNSIKRYEKIFPFIATNYIL